jgi:hypothetical protein
MARTSDRPGNGTRASSQASGTPASSEIAADDVEQISDSRSASSEDLAPSSDRRSDHGARHRSPTSGSAKKPIVTSAMATTGAGTVDLRRALVIDGRVVVTP